MIQAKLKYHCPICNEDYMWPEPVILNGQLVCEGCAAIGNEKELAAIIEKLQLERSSKRAKRNVGRPKKQA